MFYFEKKVDFITIEDILKLTSSTLLSGNNEILKSKIFGVNSIQNATNQEITFLHNVKYNSSLSETKACTCFIDKAQVQLAPSSCIPIVNPNPYLAFAKLMQFFYGVDEFDHLKEGFISPSATISPLSKLGKNVKIHENVVVSSQVEIADGVTILPNTFIGSKVKIGKNSIIYDNCSIMFATIGDDCIVRSGARIGNSGFGFAPNLQTGKHEYIPQISGVKIGNFVDIGANVAIDRGLFEDTTIGDNTKIDNLVQVGHGVKIGSSVFVAGQTGFGGSVEMGDFCFIGPQVGIASHIKIAKLTTIMGKSGIVQDVESKGKTLAGIPAVDQKLWKKMHIKLKRLLLNK